jgi:hypothetical protein
MTEESKSIADEIRNLIPEDQHGDELDTALERVARLEHEHAATVEQSALERAFLERAPREGLLYPGDALKLEDVAAKLRELGGAEQGLQQLYRDMRSSRPYLFGKPPGSPANRKISEPEPPRLRHGSLTRQVQELRRKRR